MVQEKTFEIEIWDRNRKVLYHKAYQATMFPIDMSGPGKKPKVHGWVDVDIANVEVTDGFYVHVWRGTSGIRGIHIGVDENARNEHCTATVRTDGATKEIESWQRQYLCDCWYNDESKANWMIRVVGTIMVPEG